MGRMWWGGMGKGAKPHRRSSEEHKLGGEDCDGTEGGIWGVRKKRGCLLRDHS